VSSVSLAASGAEHSADVVIVGGGCGGCAAALAAARAGCRVLLTEETDWIGGQFTQQAVPPDEHSWIEQFGATQSYRRFRTLVRQYYRQHYPLSPRAQAEPFLNPGNGSTSRLCCEPRVALAVLQSMLAPFLSGGRIRLLLRHKPIAADAAGDRIRAVTVRNLAEGREVILTARYFLDATELGELLPLCRAEHVTGSESQKETNEPHAPLEAQPGNQQAFTWCFAMDYLEGEDHMLPKPRDYEFWRQYVPKLHPAWPGPLLSWRMSDPITLKERVVSFHPYQPGPAGLDLWQYRRLADRRNFVAGTYPSDLCLVNWPQNDYWLGGLCDVAAEEAARHLVRARDLSLSLLYWLQTEAPRPDGKAGWKGLRLRGDVLGTTDGLAKYPYIRESRRIKAEFTVLEQHLGTEARMRLTGKKREALTAETFPDSVGIGSYRIDLHPSTAGDNYLDISSLPFQIPLGALLPRRVENLLPACKNLGVTHITNGCYRLHPVEWNIGEAAGALAAFCVQRKEPPRQVRKDGKLLQSFQQLLQNQGVELAWPATVVRQSCLVGMSPLWRHGFLTVPPLVVVSGPCRLELSAVRRSTVRRPCHKQWHTTRPVSRQIRRPMIAMSHAISCRNLHKQYPSRPAPVHAVNGLDLEVDPGECFGLLGPNGAGKTTTIEILEGLLTPTSGEVEVLGQRWGEDDQALRQRLGISLQETRLAEKLTVEETLTLFRSFYARGLSPATVMEQVSLTEKARAYVGKLSGGQRQRLAVACALVGDPELLFLDEPTTGLDPQSRRQLWDILRGFRAQGRTILLTTHYMDEAERLCDRVAIVDHGRVIALGTPPELIARLGGEHFIEFALNDGEQVEDRELQALPAVVSVRREEDAYCLTVTAPHISVPALLGLLESKHRDLARLTTRHASLEDVFVNLTGRHLREDVLGAA
jgi:ABC-type multidrug transport system ATPase subunit